MASEAQLRANRANALKSTGPVTPEGKRKVSQNPVRHGLLARSIILEGESPARFTALLDELNRAFEPRNGAESALVEDMTVARWHKMRLWGMGRAHMAYEIEKQESVAGNHDTVERDAPTRASIAFRSLSDNSRILDLLNRYESRCDRQFARAFDRLEKSREKRKNSKQSQNCLDLDDHHS